MESTDRTHKLLEEIRDAQLEQLAEYRRVTQLSLELQKRAVERQEQLGRIYRFVVALGSVLVTGLLALLGYLLIRWSAYLFR